MKEKLINKKREIEEGKAVFDKRFVLVSYMRLIVFLAGVILLFAGVSEKKSVLTIVGILCFMAFIALVKYHGDIEDKILGIKAKTDVIDRYLMRYSGEWKAFRDNGSEFLLKNDTLSYDLDLLGKNSLFQMISTAHTDEGRKKLAETLSLRTPHVLNMKERHQAISELSDKQDFLTDFEATSQRIVERRKKDLERQMLTEEDDKAANEESGETEKKSLNGKYPFWAVILMILIPIANIYIITTVLSGGANPSRILIGFIAGMILTWGPKGLFDEYVMPVYKYGTTAKDYLKLLKLIADEDFSSDILKKVHDRVTSRDGLIVAIKKLGTIGTVNNISFNPLAHMVLSGFLGWDYYISFFAYRWCIKNEGIFEECIDIISDIEELGSLSVIAQVRDTTEADIYTDYEKGLKLELSEVYHPLLNYESVVANDSVIDGSLTIITGSNMSGKTTFMRTIAINMVLAYTGAGVCAKNFRAPLMRLFTSMRVMDDVAGGISTFYAEILRIKDMAEYVNSGNDVPALCLIDEIFKGTNSADRIVGAEEALTKLAAGNSMVIVTTHDFELCELKKADGNDVDNYHFEEYYENGELKFDYKIRDGRCTTRNAMAILKMAGLVQN